MDSAADLLWRMNNEYRKRLSKVETYLSLLAQLMLVRDQVGQAAAFEILRHLQEQIAALQEEHRGWRYRYFYESGSDKRMVQSEHDIHVALKYFNHMRARHEHYLRELLALIDQSPRPEPSLTHVENGDLWLMMQYALHDLTAFVDDPYSVNSSQ